MSIFAARVALGFAALVLVISAIWTAITWPSISGFAVVMGIVAAVAILVSVPMIGAFVEASVRRDSVVLRRALLPRRTISFADFDDALVISKLTLASRYGAKPVERVVLRKAEKRIAAFTTRRGNFAAQLRMRDVPLVVEQEQLSPLQAQRRYPGSVRSFERFTWILPFLAIAIAVAGVLYALS